MDYQVSARKYRPGLFEDVVGQGHVVQTLVNAIATERIAHAFLFSGTRGVGKTTVARILAKALNCERGPTGSPCNACPNCLEIAQGSSVDVIEIDGASNTSVDDVREVRENVKFAPFRGRYRVYIIDEVHMLSTSAFNALLKTLEEPPAHVVFVFATTELHKIPATILSRCQHYNFRRISRGELVERLRHVAREEQLTIEDRSLAALAKASQGSMRDALSLLDQVVAFGGRRVRHTDLEVLLGAVPHEHVEGMIEAIVSPDGPRALRVIAAVLDQGHDLRAYGSELVERVRNMLVAAVVSPDEDLAKLMEATEEERHQIRQHATAFTPEQLQELFRIFSQAEDGLRASAQPRFVLEVAAIRATRIRAGAHPADQTAGVARSTGEHAKQETRAVPGETRPRPNSSGAAPRQAAPATAATPPATTVGEEAAREARPEPAEPRATSPSGGAQPDASALDWDQVQDEVEAEHPSIAPFLGRGSLVGAEGDLVTIGFSKAETVARGIIEREDNLRAVAGVCSRLTGRPTRLRVVELGEGQGVGARRADQRAAKAQEHKMVLLERTRAHPLVQQALAMFGGDVVDVRRAPLQKEGGE